MEILALLTIISGFIIMFCNVLFIWNAAQLTEYYPPVLSTLIFIIIAFISLAFVLMGLNVNIFIPYIL